MYYRLDSACTKCPKVRPGVAATATVCNVDSGSADAYIAAGCCCEQAAYMLILGYLSGIIALVAVVVYGKRKKVNISALGVGVDFMQVGHG